LTKVLDRDFFALTKQTLSSLFIKAFYQVSHRYTCTGQINSNTKRYLKMWIYHTCTWSSFYTYLQKCPFPKNHLCVLKSKSHCLTCAFPFNNNCRSFSSNLWNGGSTIICTSHVFHAWGIKLIIYSWKQLRAMTRVDRWHSIILFETYYQNIVFLHAL
jgi:hypothetical protein